MDCKQCGLVLEQVGNRQREYCSDRCRKAYKRSNPDTSNPDTSNPDTSNPDTLSTGDPVLINGFTMDEYADLGVKMSGVCRNTTGSVQVPGDRQYQGVCKQDSQGNWHL